MRIQCVLDELFDRRRKAFVDYLSRLNTMHLDPMLLELATSGHQTARTPTDLRSICLMSDIAGSGCQGETRKVGRRARHRVLAVVGHDSVSGGVSGIGFGEWARALFRGQQTTVHLAEMSGEFSRAVDRVLTRADAERMPSVRTN